MIAENIKVDEFQNTNTVLGFDNTVYDRFFSGSVDDMRLFNRALTPAEMKNIIFESLSSCNTSYPIKDSLSNNNTKNIIHKIEVPVNNNKETHVIFDKLNFQSEITRNTVPLKNVEPDVNIFTFSPNPTSAAVSFRFSKNVILNGNTRSSWHRPVDNAQASGNRHQHSSTTVRVSLTLILSLIFPAHFIFVYHYFPSRTNFF